ncbi:MAG: hypothetical protein H6510_12480 [Acidobacteria bacterium]|nr:hypothetical protein [Acidobacteriota bacterium]
MLPNIVPAKWGDQTLIHLFEMGFRQLADLAFSGWLETWDEHIHFEACSNRLKDWLKTEEMLDLFAFRCQNLKTNHELNKKMSSNAKKLQG